MRTLKFIINEQIITQDPNCDFSNLVPGSEGYLKASFTFSPEWNDSVKVAAFWSPMGREYPPQIISDDNTCLIPIEALAKRTFFVQVIGKKKDLRLTTNKVKVSQNGGNT